MAYLVEDELVIYSIFYRHNGLSLWTWQRTDGRLSRITRYSTRMFSQYDAIIYALAQPHEKSV